MKQDRKNATLIANFVLCNALLSVCVCVCVCVDVSVCMMLVHLQLGHIDQKIFYLEILSR